MVLFKFNLIIIVLFLTFRLCFGERSLYTLEFTNAKGNVIEWFESKGWEEQLDMDSMNTRFEDNKLIIEPWEAISGAFNIIFNEDMNIKKARRIRIDWGIEQYPVGADWSGPIEKERNVREAIAVMVFFGKDRIDSGSVFVPNLPYFIAFFLGEKENPNTPYFGNYWQKGGRFFCKSCNGTTGDFLTEANLIKLFKEQFKIEPPPITGIAIETDVSNTSEKEGIHSKAYLRKIELLP